MTLALTLSGSQWKTSYFKFVISISVYIVLIFNGPFFYKTYSAISSGNAPVDWGFLLSVPLLLVVLSALVISWLSVITFIKPVGLTSILLSSVLFYAELNYGVIFDKSMIQNILETNTGEAYSYLNVEVLLVTFIMGFLPSLMLYKITIIGSFRQRLKSFFRLNLMCLTIFGLIAATLYQDYASVGRNNRELTSYILPFAFYTSGYKYLRDNYFYPPLPFRILDNNPSSSKISDSSITVVVVGETARAASFSYQGYPRPTNPYTQQFDIKYFSQFRACGTATAISVPCMFSRLPQENYNAREAQSQENVLDIIQRSGVDVTWVDNNSSCKGVCARLRTNNINPANNSEYCDGDYCFDEILIEQLQRALSASSAKQKLLVLHMMGSHGPTYYRRYPDKMRQFTPECARSDIQNCDNASLINTYDNTIRYTDFVLSELIKVLESVNASRKTLIYISDHGESLGEKGLYLHGFPYALAPNEQTHIPMMYWSNQLNQAAFNQCVSKLIQHPYSHDNVFDTLLGLSNVQSSVYEADLDIFSPCKTD